MSGGGLQPYRKGSPLRMPGQALDAMTRGADAFGRNPADMQRQRTQMGADGRPQRRKRPERSPRPPRPQR